MRVGVECRKHLNFAQQINGFTHLGYGVAIFFCDGIETPLVEAKLQAAAFPGYKYYRRGPLCYWWSSHTYPAQLFYFFAFKFSLLRTGVVQYQVKRWRICAIQLDTVLRNINPAQMTIRHKWVFLHRRQKCGSHELVFFIELNSFISILVS